jgi:hypothetical protein
MFTGSMADEAHRTTLRKSGRERRKASYPFEDHADLNRIYALVALACWAGGRLALLGIMLAASVASWIAVIAGGEVRIEWLGISLP